MQKDVHVDVITAVVRQAVKQKHVVRNQDHVDAAIKFLCSISSGHFFIVKVPTFKYLFIQCIKMKTQIFKIF